MKGTFTMPGLETQHLLLLPFSLELKQAALRNKSQLAALVEARVPGHWPGPDLAEALPALVEGMEQEPLEPVWDGIILHKADRLIIGDMGFKGAPNQEGAVELGYSIIPDYRRRGYATEMARCLITWAFQEQGVQAVTAECLDTNIGSIKVLEKLGLHRLEPEGPMLKWQIRREDWTENKEQAHHAS
jgi:ribosomal-protein-alanine N-acetyltransferase